jgi:hypothetical protein
MKSQFVATPSCGAPPLFETYTAGIDDTLQQFDWNLVNRLHPDTIRATQDTESLDKLLYSFVDSKYGAVERQFLPFPLSAKFFQLLQIGVDYLLRKLTKTQKQVSQKETEIEYLRHKLEKSVERLDSLPKFTNSEVKVVHSCPVCSRAFKAMLYLDKHVRKCHANQMDAWHALRNDEPYGISIAFKELHQDIDHLRSCITRQDLHTDPPRTSNEMPVFAHKPKQKGIGTPGRITGGTGIEPRFNRKDFMGDSPPKSGLDGVSRFSMDGDLPDNDS